MSINFSSFEIGRRALLANQLGINITGQNISNVNTPGYSRQRVSLGESAPINFNGQSFGTGVTVQGVQAFRDRFIESRIQTETGIAGRLNAERNSISQVEVALQGSENGGLQNALNGFFGAFRDLDANPNSLPTRAVAAQKGSALASAFQSTRSRLEQIRTGADGQIRTTVTEVNSLSQKIADLNGQIKNAESSGGNAATLRDQRGDLINQISGLTGARSSENADGTINLTIGEGRALVSGDHAFSVKAESAPPLGLANLTIDGQPAIFDEGTIRGFQNAITETTKQISALDDLAAQVVQRVNDLHTSGTDLDGNAGINFFNPGTPVTAANISVNSQITTDPRLVVSSPLAQPGQNGTIAGEIANLLTDQNTTVGSRTGSFSSIFGSLVSEAGEQVRTAENNLQTQAAIISQATEQRAAISGVSLDEEAINLLQYQKAYEAAARFLKIADEMTQTILSLAG